MARILGTTQCRSQGEDKNGEERVSVCEWASGGSVEQEEKSNSYITKYKKRNSVVKKRI